MRLGPDQEDLIRQHNFFDQFPADLHSDAAIWIVDREDQVVDLSPSTARYFGTTREAIIGKRLRDILDEDLAEEAILENALIFRERRPTTLVKWFKMSIGWRKVIQTKTLLGEDYIIGISHDLTDVDPLGEWLLNVDVVKRSLNLGERYHNEDVTLPEWVVLHRLARGKSYRDMAAEFSISVPAIKNRILRLKEKFGVESMEALWEEIFSSGLVHLLALPMGLDDIESNDLDFMGLDPMVTRDD